MIWNPVTPAPCPRRRKVIFYLVDVSGSMSANGYIGMLDRAMEDSAAVLAGICLSNKDNGDIYINCIPFSDRAILLDSAPVCATEFRWQPQQAYGRTNLAAALALLEDQMLLLDQNPGPGYLRPAVVLLSDGEPDDGWEEALARIRRNRWFCMADKVAVAIGNAGSDAFRNALNQFARPQGDASACVVDVCDASRLAQAMTAVSSTVSRLAPRHSAGASMASEIHAGEGVKISPISHDSDYWD